MADLINHPPHYTKFPVEVIEITELNDLLKARWYIEREINRVGRGDA